MAVLNNRLGVCYLSQRLVNWKTTAVPEGNFLCFKNVRK